MGKSCRLIAVPKAVYSSVHDTSSIAGCRRLGLVTDAVFVHKAERDTKFMMHCITDL